MRILWLLVADGSKCECEEKSKRLPGTQVNVSEKVKVKYVWQLDFKEKWRDLKDLHLIKLTDTDHKILKRESH